MIAKMEKPIKIFASMCDNTLRMSIPDMFLLFMDLATEHAAQIGLGADVLSKRDMYWITVRTKVQILDRPQMMDELTAATWPAAPGIMRCNRYYRLSDGEVTFATGKSEWAIIDVKGGSLQKLSEVYPDKIEHPEEIVCKEPYARIKEGFDGCEVLGTYTVRSTDIDMGQHMNNVAYVKMIFGAFSCKELEEMNICETDIAFRTPCYEGDELTLYKRIAENAIEIGVIRADGTTAATARLVTSNK